nr:hypothetical protein [Terribacillus saccharophilus]
MGLNPKIEAFLKEVNAHPISLESVSPEQFRNQARMQEDAPKQEVAKVEDSQIELHDRTRQSVSIVLKIKRSRPLSFIMAAAGWLAALIRTMLLAAKLPIWQIVR